MNIDNKKPFDEDNFDVDEYKKSKAAFVRKRETIERRKRNISIGRTLIFVGAVLILVIVYYFAVSFLSQM